jgi:hypothetical protein
MVTWVGQVTVVVVPWVGRSSYGLGDCNVGEAASLLVSLGWAVAPSKWLDCECGEASLGVC